MLSFCYRRIQTYQLGHRFLRFFLRLYVDAKISKMKNELGVDARIITRVTIYV